MLDLLAEHFEDLDFLWQQRERVVLSRDWTLPELAALEARAEAHLDGLRLGAGHSVELALPFLTGKDPCAATAAAFVSMSAGDVDLCTTVVRALGPENRDARDGVRVALRHVDARPIACALADLAATGDQVTRALVSDVLSFHHLPVPATFSALLRLGETELEVQRLAFGAAGRFGGPWDLWILESVFEKDEPVLQRAAFDASARLAIPGLADALRRIAAGRAGVGAEALACLGLLGDRTSLPLLLTALTKRETANGALAGLGALGDPSAVPAILDAMSKEETVLAASAAFLRITGATGIGLAEPPSLPEEPSEEESDLSDEPLPLDQLHAKAWWRENGPRFKPSQRWQVGVDVSNVSHSPDLLDGLPLDIRRDLFLSARARDRGYAPGFEPEAHTPSFGIGGSLPMLKQAH